MSHVKIDDTRCKGCGLCTIACPMKLVAMNSELNGQGNFTAVFSDPEGKCTACAMCARMCPDVAITVFRE